MHAGVPPPEASKTSRESVLAQGNTVHMCVVTLDVGSQAVCWTHWLCSSRSPSVSAFLRVAPGPAAAASPGNLLETVTPHPRRNRLGASRGSERGRQGGLCYVCTPGMTSQSPERNLLLFHPCVVQSTSPPPAFKVRPVFPHPESCSRSL